MITALVVLGSSGALVLFMSTVFLIEDFRQGRLLFASRTRIGLSNLLERFVSSCRKIQYTITHGVFLAVVYYFLHSVLKQVLKFIRSFEQRVEKMLRKNKARATAINENSEKTYLQSIADHKVEVALTDAQKQKLKAHH